MLVSNIMNIFPVWVYSDTNVRHAAEVFSLVEVSDIMVIDQAQNFIGVLSEGDLLRSLLPDLEEILGVGGTLTDAFYLFIQKGSKMANQPIARLIIQDPITVKPGDEVAKAATIMVQKQIRRLPVVENNRLVGTISRSDICRSVIFNTKLGGTHSAKDSSVATGL
jgi:CBS domain-containing protein